MSSNWTTEDLLSIFKVEELWFGEPVYIFDNNRLWVEKNFTLSDLLKTTADE